MIQTLFHVAVYGYVLNAEGRLLIVKRAEHDSMPGHWELPGGSLEDGETIEEGVRREVLEEAGIDVTVGKPFHISTINSADTGRNILRIFYYCTPMGSTDVVLSEEHAAFCWVDPKEFTESPLTSSLEAALVHA